ncbi:hypothetical protein PIB30_109592, partial [Stylosanthes scabra]|nr:hypothetical protein [Stylosanthes scabra]
MKGIRRNNLYYYQGSTIVGTVAAVTTTPSSDDEDTEATKLWHRRLGYASEKALQTLAKQRLLKNFKA